MTAEQDPSKPTRYNARAVRPTYIHELADWPNFRWHQEDVTMPLGRATSRLTELVALILAQGDQAANELTVQNLADSAVASSRIEAEFPHPNAVRQAIARRMAAGSQLAIQNEPGIAVVTADAAQRHDELLTAERLHEWHRLLFPNAGPKQMTVSDWRDDRLGPMQVVSISAIGRRPIVHFEAPAAARLEAEMDRFLEWFNQPGPEPDLRKAAIAHLWFVTIHPYDPVASPENVTETLAPGIRYHQRHSRGAVGCRWCCSSPGVNQLLGHDATPLFQPALHGSQLGLAEPVRVF